MKKKSISIWAVCLAIILGMLAGTFTGQDTKIFNVTFYSIYDLIGNLFLNALLLIVVPLIFSSIISGVAKLGKTHAAGRIGIKTVGTFICINLLGILTGVIFSNLFTPLLEDTAKYVTIPDLNTLQNGAPKVFHPVKIADIFLQIIPSNILDIFSHERLLSLIVFSLLFGFVLSKSTSHATKVIKDFFEGFFQIMLHITQLIIKLLPVAVFFLVARQFAVSGWSSLESLLSFFLLILCGFVFFLFGILFVILKFIGKVNPLSYIKAMLPALLTAFSTSSSAATLPITLDCLEERVGISNKICGFTVPLGTSLNMAGSSLYAYSAAFFLAKVYGIDLTIASQGILFLLVFLISFGIAGVPSGVIIAVMVVLKGIGLPIEGIGLLFAIDRFIDMFRTVVNVFTNSTSSLLVARFEGEKKLLKKL